MPQPATTSQSPNLSLEQLSGLRDSLSSIDRTQLTPDRQQKYDQMVAHLNTVLVSKPGVPRRTGDVISQLQKRKATTYSDLPPGYTEEDLSPANIGPTTGWDAAKQELKHASNRVGDIGSGLASVAWNTAKDMIPFAGAPDPSKDPQGYIEYHKNHPDIIDATVGAHKHEFDLQRQAAQRGDVKGAAIHGAAASVPVWGPILGQTYEDANQGHPGDVIANLGAVLAPTAVKQLRGLARGLPERSSATATTFSGQGTADSTVSANAPAGLPARKPIVEQSRYGGPKVAPDLSRTTSTATNLRRQAVESSLSRGSGKAKAILREAAAQGKEPGLVYNENFPSGHARADVAKAEVQAVMDEIHAATNKHIAETPELAGKQIAKSTVLDTLNEPWQEAEKVNRGRNQLAPNSDADPQTIDARKSQEAFLKENLGTTNPNLLQLNKLKQFLDGQIRNFKPLTAADQSTAAVLRRQADGIRSLIESASTLPNGANYLRGLNHDYASLAAVRDATDAAMAEGRTDSLFPRTPLLAGTGAGALGMVGHPLVGAAAGAAAGGIYDLLNNPVVGAKVGRLLRMFSPKDEYRGVVRPPADVPYELYDPGKEPPPNAGGRTSGAGAGNTVPPPPRRPQPQPRPTTSSSTTSSARAIPARTEDLSQSQSPYAPGPVQEAEIVPPKPPKSVEGIPQRKALPPAPKAVENQARAKEKISYKQTVSDVESRRRYNAEGAIPMRGEVAKTEATAPTAPTTPKTVKSAKPASVGLPVRTPTTPEEAKAMSASGELDTAYQRDADEQAARMKAREGGAEETNPKPDPKAAQVPQAAVGVPSRFDAGILDQEKQVRLRITKLRIEGKGFAADKLETQLRRSLDALKSDRRSSATADNPFITPSDKTKGSWIGNRVVSPRGEGEVTHSFVNPNSGENVHRIVRDDGTSTVANEEELAKQQKQKQEQKREAAPKAPKATPTPAPLAANEPKLGTTVKYRKNDGTVKSGKLVEIERSTSRSGETIYHIKADHLAADAHPVAVPESKLQR